jgi:hypothetical protein
VACIYIGWEVSGYMIKSNLVLICYNHILYIRNSNKLEPNLLHDRSNLVLIFYNHILSIRNSNKLETKSVAHVRSLVGRL